MKMKNLFAFAVMALALAFVFVSCSNSTSDDGGSGTPAVVTGSGAGTDYYGNFKVNNKEFSLISFDSNTYTMYGAGTNDSGTYSTGKSARAGLASGTTYTLSSNNGNGAFTVTRSGSTLTFGGDASGAATDILAVASSSLPTASGTCPLIGKTFKMFEVSGSYEWDRNQIFKFTDSTVVITKQDEEGEKWSNEYSYTYNASTGIVSWRLNSINGLGAEDYFNKLVKNGATSGTLLLDKDYFIGVEGYSLTAIDDTTYTLESVFPDKITNSNFPHEKLQVSLVKYRGNSHKTLYAEHFRALR